MKLEERPHPSLNCGKDGAPKIKIRIRIRSGTKSGPLA